MKTIEPRYAPAGATIKARLHSMPRPCQGQETVACWHPGEHVGGGFWICIACGERFRNNLEASGHTKRGHALAWYCGAHGAIEQGPREMVDE